VNGFNFTERVRKVLPLAREAAVRRNHEYVGTEHILIAMLDEGEGVAAAALQSLGVNFDALKKAVDAIAKSGAGPGASTSGSRICRRNNTVRV